MQRDVVSLLSGFVARCITSSDTQATCTGLGLLFVDVEACTGDEVHNKRNAPPYQLCSSEIRLSGNYFLFQGCATQVYLLTESLPGRKFVDYPFTDTDLNP